MAVFVLAPVFEEVEDREDLALRMLLQVAINSDVTPVTDLFAQVGGVKDELGLEEGVGLISREKTQIELQPEISHCLVQEAGMAGLIPGHVGEAFGQQGVFAFDPAAQLLVKQEAGKFRGAALLKKLNKNLAGFGVEFGCRPVEFGVAHEMVAVVVLAELLADGLQLQHVGLQIHRRHGVKIRGVEAGGQDCVPDRILGRRCFRGGWGGGNRGGRHHLALRLTAVLAS